jgi:hypothetical protein
MSLRSKLIRLAHENPDLRQDLLPLIQAGGSAHSTTAASDKPLTGREVRKDMYSFFDGVSALEITISKSPILSQDKELRDLAKQVSRLGLQIHRHLNEHYTWD